MNMTTELEELRQEVSALRAEQAQLAKFVNPLRRFFSVDTWDDLPGQPSSLQIKATEIFLSHPARPKCHQLTLHATEQGPRLDLRDAAGDARLRLQVKADAAQLELFTQELKPCVQLRVMEPEGRGEVNVFEAGKPRATMKGTAQGAAVAVTHDDGNARMMLCANAEAGELIGANLDMRTAVKISTDFQDGAVFALHGTNVRPLVFMTATSKGGMVLTSDPKGNVLGTVPPLPEAEE